MPPANTMSPDVPLHRQIMRVLESRIINGLYPPGSTIPSEMRLCEEFGASRITVRQSLGALAERGLLKRYRGRGTIVAEEIRPMGVPASMGYLEDVLLFFAATKVSGSERKTIPAPDEVAEQLGLQPGTPVTVITRWRTLRDEPFCISSTYVTAELAANIADEDLARSTFIEMLERHFGTTLSGAHQVIWAENASAMQAKHLGIAEGAAMFCFTLVYYAPDETPVAYTRTAFRGDRYQHHVRLGRVPIGAGAGSTHNGTTR